MRITARSRANPTRRRSGDTVPVTVRPTGSDVTIANAIARNTEPAPEAIARALTWGADEKVLLDGWLHAGAASRYDGQATMLCSSP